MKIEHGETIVNFKYLDGTQAKSSNNAAGINPVGTTRDPFLGGDPQCTYANNVSANPVRNFEGRIAHMAFGTNALTVAQIHPPPACRLASGSTEAKSCGCPRKL